MASRRIERLNEQLRREITEILHFEVKDPRIGRVTVTGARTSPDLSFARVFVMLPGDPEIQKEALIGLRAASPFVRGELGRRLSIRRVPELRFELDETLENALRIERLLHEVLPAGTPHGEEPEEPEADAEGR